MFSTFFFFFFFAIFLLVLRLEHCYQGGFSFSCPIGKKSISMYE